MLIFHEGLPGSGKTYEAMVKHILPALSDGRLVVTNVDGLGEIDYLSSISQLVNQPLSHVQKNIVFLDKDQVSKINLYVPDNALVVIDELQNYFPSGRERLSPDIVSWVSEHRHLGIDVVVISQDIKEVHNLFRRRVDRKICFLKLDALGLNLAISGVFSNLWAMRSLKRSLLVLRFISRNIFLFINHMLARRFQLRFMLIDVPSFGIALKCVLFLSSFY